MQKKITRKSVLIILEAWVLILVGGCSVQFEPSPPLDLKFSSRFFEFDINILFEQLKWNEYYIAADSIAWCAIPNKVGNQVVNFDEESKLFIVYGTEENNLPIIAFFNSESPFEVRIGILHKGVYTELYPSRDYHIAQIGQIAKIEVKEPSLFLLTETETIRSGNATEKGEKTFFFRLSQMDTVPIGELELVTKNE